MAPYKCQKLVVYHTIYTKGFYFLVFIDLFVFIDKDSRIINHFFGANRPALTTDQVFQTGSIIAERSKDEQINHFKSGTYERS